MGVTPVNIDSVAYPLSLDGAMAFTYRDRYSDMALAVRAEEIVIYSTTDCGCAEVGIAGGLAPR